MKEQMATQSVVSTAAVKTDRPARYGKQLASHLGRRVTSEWDEETGRGTLTFDAGHADLISADGELLMTLETGPDDVARLEDVLGRHLVRFGTKDELIVVWERDNDTPGTTQRLDTDES
jgi:hypothetical protein